MKTPVDFIFSILARKNSEPYFYYGTVFLLIETSIFLYENLLHPNTVAFPVSRLKYDINYYSFHFSVLNNWLEIRRMTENTWVSLERALFEGINFIVECLHWNQYANFNKCISILLLFYNDGESWCELFWFRIMYCALDFSISEIIWDFPKFWNSLAENEAFAFLAKISAWDCDLIMMC